MNGKTEFEKNMEFLRREIPLLNSNRYFSCKNLSARISVEQCAINFKKAELFDEVEYLNRSDKKPYWGFYGKSGFAHPLITKCKNCGIGEMNFCRIGIKKKQGVGAAK